MNRPEKFQLIENSNVLAVSGKPNSVIGPNEEELHGLNIEERQKRRHRLNDNEYMETENVNGSFL